MKFISGENDSYFLVYLLLSRPILIRNYYIGFKNKDTDKYREEKKIIHRQAKLSLGNHKGHIFQSEFLCPHLGWAGPETGVRNERKTTGANGVAVFSSGR